MIDNHDAVLKSLVAFLWANAPAGAERDVHRLKLHLEDGTIPSYIGMEFRPTEDTSAQLYVRVEGAEHGPYGDTRVEDADGNLWHAFRVRCQVSWPSWGSSDVSVCQRRLALMTEVSRFAAEVERAFPRVFHQLYKTAVERVEDEARVARGRAQAQIVELVKAHAKGMKVGQEKIVPVPGSDFQPVCPLEVEREEGGRRFKYRATATSTDGFGFTREA